jgi:hypothetical protein
VVNKLALSAHLGHSSETGWNEHDSSYYSKQNSVLSQGKILAILTGLYKHCKEPSLCTKEAQRTIRGILISTKNLHIKFQVKKL